MRIDGSWKHYVENKRLKGRWEKHETGLNYYPLFTTALFINPDAELKSLNQTDFIKFNEIPSVPEKIRIVFPFKAGGKKKTATYEIEQKSVADYMRLLRSTAGSEH